VAEIPFNGGLVIPQNTHLHNIVFERKNGESFTSKTIHTSSRCERQLKIKIKTKNRDFCSSSALAPSESEKTKANGKEKQTETASTAGSALSYQISNSQKKKKAALVHLDQVEPSGLPVLHRRDALVRAVRGATCQLRLDDYRYEEKPSQRLLVAQPILFC
jgi:hypothetical protein